MLTDAEIAGMRSTSLSAMPDTGTITRIVGTGSLNATTGVFTPTASSSIYSGVMRVRPPTPTEMDVIFGDTEVSKQRYVGTIPHDATMPAVDDRLLVTSSSDADVGDRTFRITSVSAGSFQIDRRLGLEVIE